MSGHGLNITGLNVQISTPKTRISFFCYFLYSVHDLKLLPGVGIHGKTGYAFLKTNSCRSAFIAKVPISGIRLYAYIPVSNVTYECCRNLTTQ